MWLAQELGDALPGSHLTSGGLGAMGYALPAGLGAAIGQPDRSVWVVAGDGGFQMSLQELATVVQEGIPLRIAVIDNGYLGMVRQWQERFYGRRYSGHRFPGRILLLWGKPMVFQHGESTGANNSIPPLALQPLKRVRC
ncbi:MAG: hypothetical protein Ct9H300mP15_26050 [Gemmatimonadota bacterium]|nr:MAG: hypothetical protein Ct9H300mP15_26050 [Gemmatimonadota bacterium]